MAWLTTAKPRRLEILTRLKFEFRVVVLLACRSRLLCRPGSVTVFIFKSLTAPRRPACQWLTQPHCGRLARVPRLEVTGTRILRLSHWHWPA